MNKITKNKGEQEERSQCRDIISKSKEEFFKENEELEQKILSIKKIKEEFDSSNQLLAFVHEIKKYVETEVVTDWFDINQSDKVTWLLVRLTDTPQRYKQIKLENVKSFKIITKAT